MAAGINHWPDGGAASLMSNASTWYTMDGLDPSMKHEFSDRSTPPHLRPGGQGTVHTRAADIASLLVCNYAHITGGEIHDQPIIGIPAHSWGDVLSAKVYDLVKVFSFLVWAGSYHIQTRSFPSKYYVICDMRMAEWSQVKELLAKLQKVLPVGVQSIFVVSPTSRLSLAKIGFKSFTETLQCKVETVPSFQSLQRVFPLHVLTVDFGGQLKFSNDDWVALFMRAEAIGEKCHSLCQLLSETREECRTVAVPSLSSHTEEVSEKLRLRIEQVLEDAKQQVDQANRFVQEMLPENCRWHLSPTTNHYQGISSRVQLSSGTLENQLSPLQDAWEKQCERLKTVAQSQKYREVMIEFHADAMKERDRVGRDIGTSVASVNKLMVVHSKQEAAVKAKLYESAPVLLEEVNFFTARPHCYKPDETRELCKKLSQELKELSGLLNERSKQLAISMSLFESVDKGFALCEEGLHLLATQPLEACLSEGTANDSLLHLGRFLDRLEEINCEEMLATVRSLPFDDSVAADVEKLKRKSAETQNLITARVEGIMTLTSKHNEMKVQLSAAAEKGSMSGASTGSTTPPPMQDTAACSVSSNASVLSAPSLERSGQSHPQLSHTSSLSPVTARRHLSSGQLRRIQHAPPRRSTTASALSAENGSHSMEAMSRRTSLPVSPSHRPSLTPDSMTVDDEALFDDPIEDSETDEKILEKRRFIMKELIDTERDYINDLKEALDGYWSAMRPDNDAVPPFLRAKQNILFGNLPRIYEFHKNTFLEELESYTATPERVGLCFLNKHRHFQLYVSYCKNKYKSDAFLADSDMTFFENIRKQRGHRLSFKTYLIKPVQRITKYQLLLKDMMTKCGGAPMARVALQRALDEMLDVLQHVNNVMHSVGIIGFPGSLLEQGHLLLQDSFTALKEGTGRLKLLRGSRAERERHVFLYQQVLIFSKKRQQSEGDRQTLYSYKDSIKISELALTETADGVARRFQVAHHNHGKVYTLQARTESIKNQWVGDLRSLLKEQLTNMQNMAKQEEGLLTLPRAYSGRFSDAGFSGGGFSARSSLRLSHANEVHWSQSTLTRRNTLRRHDNIAENATEDTSADGAGSCLTLGQSLGNLSMDSLGDGDDLLDGSNGTTRSAGLTAVPSEHQYVPVNPVDVDESFIVSNPDSRQFYTVTAEFKESEDLCFPEGTPVEVIQLGHGGWWAVRKVETNEFGWIPASYLSEITSRTSLPLLETSI